MKRPGIPLFLQRRPYRRRRRMDAARLLPVFGLFLLLLPMLWEPVPDMGRRTARDAIYLFAVWAGLIVVARLLASGLMAADRGGVPPASAEDEDG